MGSLCKKPGVGSVYRPVFGERLLPKPRACQRGFVSESLRHFGACGGCIELLVVERAGSERELADGCAERSRKRGKRYGREGSAVGSPAPLVAIAQARDLYGLTAREEEILCLLAQKKTVPTIAADMFLAQGTVKAHVQHIYQKDGHSQPQRARGVLGCEVVLARTCRASGRRSCPNGSVGCCLPIDGRQLGQ